MTRVLLTGAGFTKNFGGLLANEMSNNLFNDDQIQKNSELRKLVTRSSNYELIYDLVMNSDSLDHGTRKIFHRGLEEAYQNLDKRIIATIPPQSQTIGDMYKFFIKKFSKKFGGSGYFFTLNQDVFIERTHRGYPEVGGIELPIIGTNVENLSDPLTKDKRRYMHAQDEFINEKQKYDKKVLSDKIPFSYIKLHGSQEWYTEPDNSLMLIGGEKSQLIANSELLKWYFEIFSDQIKKAKQLVVVGYSFADEHVNEIIAGSDLLEIIVVDTKNRTDFFSYLMKKNSIYISKILDQISYYACCSIENLFPRTAQVSPDWESLQDKIFGG